MPRPATPLAWKNLTGDFRKLVLASGGVAFAVILMFMQIGFRNALFDNTVQVAKLLKADLFLVSRARYNLPSEQRFDRVVLDRAKSIQGVAHVHPIYIERSLTELRVIGNTSRSIRVVGVPDHGEIFVDPRLNELRAQIADGRTALLDRRTKTPYGFERRDLDRLRQQDVELSGKSIRMVEWIDVGTDFVHDGTLVVSEQAFPHYFQFRNPGADPLALVDIGLVQLEDSQQIDVVRQELMKLGPLELDVLSKDEIIQREVHFWATATPIGIIFTVGTIMGLVVGTIICYQILFTDISDHISEFATLKAMGYGSNYFLKLVLQQSLYLTLFGFLPGWIVSFGLYQLLTSTTGLIMLMTAPRIGLVFALTLVMCLLSGILAVRKLWSADPASLFK